MPDKNDILHRLNALHGDLGVHGYASRVNPISVIADAYEEIQSLRAENQRLTTQAAAMERAHKIAQAKLAAQEKTLANAQQIYLDARTEREKAMMDLESMVREKGEIVLEFCGGDFAVSDQKIYIGPTLEAAISDAVGEGE